MRVFKTTYLDRRGKRREAKNWYVEFQDPQDAWRRLPAFPDKRASEEFGRKLERLVSLRVAGEQPDPAMTRWIEQLPARIRNRLAGQTTPQAQRRKRRPMHVLDPRSVASARPLKVHLADYQQSLLDSGATPEYVQKTVNRVTAILEGTGATFLSDLRAAAVSRFLAERRASGLSVKSSNHYLSAAKKLSQNRF